MTLSRPVALAVAVTLFATSRLYLLFGFVPDQSDMYLYVQYAWEDEVALSQGRPLYLFHTEQFDRAQAHALATGAEPPMAETRSIEYPPLALQSVLLPKALVERPSEVPWKPHDWPLLGYISGYDRAFRSAMAGFDTLAFTLLIFFVPRVYPRESTTHHLERWLTYVGAGHLLGHLLYDRLSLPPGAFLLGAVGLLTIPRVPAVFGLGLLAAAINYQLSPLVLLPLFILGCVPARRVQDPPVSLIRAAAVPGIVAAALIVALFLPFYVREGPESVAFLRYHGQRGLQLESVAATLPLLLSFAGHTVTRVGEFGAWHLRSTLAPVLAKASPVLILLLVGVVLWLVIRNARSRPLLPEIRFASEGAPLFAGAVVASLAMAVVGSKVFSPQYLLWMLPLVPLAPARLLLPLFVAVAAVTTAVFPYAYDAHVSALTTGGKLLLAARNGLFLAFAAAAVLALRRRPV
jgi:hypothetical protein